MRAASGAAVHGFTACNRTEPSALFKPIEAEPLLSWERERLEARQHRTFALSDLCLPR